MSRAFPAPYGSLMNAKRIAKKKPRKTKPTKGSPVRPVNVHDEAERAVAEAAVRALRGAHRDEGGVRSEDLHGGVRQGLRWRGHGDAGQTPRALNRPMQHLKSAGRVRSAGERGFTRYFPMTSSKAA